MNNVPTRIGFADEQDHRRVVVEWLMSSVCNYSCSYCPMYLHDSRVRWPRYDDIVRFCNRVCDHYAGQRLTFLLSGGEVTLFRDLGRLARHLREVGAQVAVLTNGSRPLPWWDEHMGYFDEVIISYHHEQADRDHLVAVAQRLAPRTLVQLNIVIDPAAFDETMAFAARAEQETAAVVNRKIMFLDGWKRPAPYRADQHQRLTEALAAERQPVGTVLKGSLAVHFDDGRTRVMSALKIIDERLNHWEGWDCSAGESTLFIRFDEVWRAACRVGGPLGSIYDDHLRLPTQSIQCTATACNCIAGIKAVKSAEPIPVGR